MAHSSLDELTAKFQAARKAGEADTHNPEQLRLHRELAAACPAFVPNLLRLGRLLQLVDQPDVDAGDIFSEAEQALRQAVQGSERGAPALVELGDQGMLEFNSLEFTAPQDAFSRIILGTSSHLWRRKELPEDEREELLRFVSETQWLMGMVSTSESLPEEFFRQVALELARRLGGKVFDGTDFLSPEPRG